MSNINSFNYNQELTINRFRSSSFSSHTNSSDSSEVIDELPIEPSREADKSENIYNILTKQGQTAADILRSRLDLIKQMQESLDKQGGFVILGAPGSGKSELLALAVESEPATFDLRKEFLESYFQQHGITDPQVQAQVKKEEYQTPHFKELELEWINHNYELIKEKLIGDSSNVVVLDEVDLAKKFEGAAIDSTKKMVSLAQDCIAAGKKVVLVLHTESVQSPEVMAQLQQSGIVQSPNDIITTRYFTKLEESALLAQWGIIGNAASKFMNQAKGIPAAYLPILKDAASGIEPKADASENLASLLESAKEQIQKNYLVTKKTMPENVVSLLKDIAVGRISKENLNHKLSVSDLEALSSTGLIKVEDGHAIMPPLVKQVIRQIEGLV